MTDEDYMLDLPKACPHRRHVTTCNDCLNDYCKAEELLEGVKDEPVERPEHDPWERTRSALP